MLWTKCNKIITEGNKIINCESCPCPYWAVLGFKWRWLDCETMQPDLCSWNYSVEAKEVINGAVNWDYGCIKIKNGLGLVGSKKGKFNCQSECYEWDENDNCIDQYESCECIEVEVYNISGCFSEYQEFEAAFYGGCGVTPDSSGEYPAIFQTYYGYKYMSSSAWDCVENYWNRIFSEKYLLNYNIEIQYMNQNWWQGVAGGVYETEYYEYCGDDDCYYYDENWGDGCPEGYQTCYEEYEGGIIGFRAYARCENSDALSYYATSRGIGEDEGECCASVASVAELPEVNAHITEKVNDKASYFTNGTNNYTCTDSGSLCRDVEYNSRCWDNFYGDFCGCRISFNWCRFKVTRTDSTPADAKGVKFLCKVKHIRTNEGWNKNNASTTTETEITVDALFDEYCESLPLATDTNLLDIFGTPQCDKDCWQKWESDGTGHPKRWWKNSPHYNWWDQTLAPYENDCWKDAYQIKIIGSEYIK